MSERVGAHEIVIRAQRPSARLERVSIIMPLPAADADRTCCLVAHGRVTRAVSHRRNGVAALAVSIRDSRLEQSERAFDRAG